MTECCIDRDNIAGNTREIYNCFFDWAKSLSSAALGVYVDEEGSWIGWPLEEKAILVYGPAEARKRGFLVEEFNEGWSAILPMSESVDPKLEHVSPGACYVITAARAEIDGEDMIAFQTCEFIWKDNQSPLAEHGWKFHVGRSSKQNVYEYNKPTLDFLR